MSDYKFLDAKDVDRILRDGTLRIASLSHYRSIEADQWIGDRLEGTVRVNIREAVVTGDEAADWAPEGFPMIAKASDGGRIYIENCVAFYQVPEFYIFCFSRGDLEILTTAMCTNSDRPYDSCIQIRDAELLAHRMFYRGRILELDIPVRRAFLGFRSGLVVYENIDREHTAGRPPPPSPFLKHTAFREQSEVRVVLQPMKPIDVPVLTVKIPQPDEILNEVFRGVRRSPIIDSKPADHHDAAG